MQIDQKVTLLQSELGELKNDVSELISDEGSRAYLRFEERTCVEEILNAPHEDIQVLEKGAEVIALILAGVEN